MCMYEAEVAGAVVIYFVWEIVQKQMLNVIGICSHHATFFALFIKL